MTTPDEFLEAFEKIRGYRPNAKMHTDRAGTVHIVITGFEEITISRDGRCDMPRVRSFPEGNDYAPAVALGWPVGRGEAAKVACIFADFYATRKRGQKPPYFSLTPKQIYKHSSE